MQAAVHQSILTLSFLLPIATPLFGTPLLPQLKTTIELCEEALTRHATNQDSVAELTHLRNLCLTSYTLLSSIPPDSVKYEECIAALKI